MNEAIKEEAIRIEAKDLSGFPIGEHS